MTDYSHKRALVGPKELSQRCLSVVMPVYNEASTVADVIRKVLEQPQVAELIVVDDASTDGTWDVLQRIFVSESSPASGMSPLKTFRHDISQSKGAALRSGIARDQRTSNWKTPCSQISAMLPEVQLPPLYIDRVVHRNELSAP